MKNYLLIPLLSISFQLFGIGVTHLPLLSHETTLHEELIDGPIKPPKKNYGQRRTKKRGAGIQLSYNKFHKKTKRPKKRHKWTGIRGSYKSKKQPKR